MEWVEVRGKTVEIAVRAALEELGIESADQAEVKVIQEPERGFLGMGARQAVVQVKPRPTKRRRKSRSKSKGGESRQGESQERQRRSGGNNQQNRAKREPDGTPKRRAQQSDSRGAKGQAKNGEEQVSSNSEEPSVSREEQAQVVKDFLVGLLDAYGLEGKVEVSVDDAEIIHADMSGPQTEALVGAKGSIMQSVHELSRTVVQRQTHENVRLRLDIAGYAERRREALAIYAGRLSEQVQSEGAEVMLEPMNAADRKVIHDAVQALEGVRSYSEGEEPRRSVVISPE